MDSELKIKDRLLQLRTEKKVSQKQVGKYLGVTKETISGYENGKSLPPVDRLVDLARYFDVSTDYLCGLTSPNYIELKGLTDDQSKRIREAVLPLIRAYQAVNKYTDKIMNMD